MVGGGDPFYLKFWVNRSEIADFKPIFARCKIALRLKKVCYKVSLFENCQGQSCKAFIGLTICAKIIGGDEPFYLKFWINLTALERNRRFSIYFRS